MLRHGRDRHAVDCGLQPADAWQCGDVRRARRDGAAHRSESGAPGAGACGAMSGVPQDSAKRPTLMFVVSEDWYFCSHRLPLAIAAIAAGYDVSVGTRSTAHRDQMRAAGLRVIPFEIARGTIDPFTQFRVLGRLIALYRRERPDVVHHVAMKPVLYGSIAARLAGKPQVVNAVVGTGSLFSSATGPAKLLKPVVRLALGRLLSSGIALVQNPDDARLLAQLGVPESRIRRIPGSGVDLNRFRPQQEAPGIPVVVLPSRLLWDKGVGEFVSAARLLREKGVTARFVLAGEPDRDNPSAVPSDQIARWVKEGVVAHLGWVKDMPRLLGDSHVVCLPSFYGEGIPKSLIEAAAAGLPIVTTDMPGCREVVHHEDNGL